MSPRPVTPQKWVPAPGILEEPDFEEWSLGTVILPSERESAARSSSSPPVPPDAPRPGTGAARPLQGGEQQGGWGSTFSPAWCPRDTAKGQRHRHRKRILLVNHAA